MERYSSLGADRGDGLLGAQDLPRCVHQEYHQQGLSGKTGRQNTHSHYRPFQRGQGPGHDKPTVINWQLIVFVWHFNFVKIPFPQHACVDKTNNQVILGILISFFSALPPHPTWPVLEGAEVDREAAADRNRRVLCVVHWTLWL